MVVGLLVSALYLWSGRRSGELRPPALADLEDEAVTAETSQRRAGV